MSVEIFWHNINTDLESFYENLKYADFTKITEDDINNLTPISIELNKFYKNPYSQYSKSIKYAKTLNRIKGNSIRYNLNKPEKKFILEVMSIDPKLKALMIYSECNKVSEAKSKLEREFGIYDINLIKIEKEFIKTLNKNDREKIENEILEKSFK